MASNKQINKIVSKFLKTLPEMEKEYDKDGKIVQPTAFEISNHIIDNGDENLISIGNQLCLYDEGCFYFIDNRSKSENSIKRLMQKALNIKHVPAKLIESVHKEVLTHYYELTPYDDGAGTTFINMYSNVIAVKKDGSIDILEHDKKYNFTYRLSYDYDPNAEATVFMQFLKTSLVHDELILIIFEFLAYTISKNSKNYEKALFLYGSGSNGKSTLLNIIKELFGVENISFVELTQMNDMLQTALMDSKLLNISSDAKKSGLDTSAFKKIVSGEQILGKFLFQNIYTIEILPKIIVAMNKLPYHNGDNTVGFYRRLLLIPFTVTIEEKDKDYMLESKVINNELAGVMNLVIEGLKRLNSQGGFTSSAIMDELMNSYKESMNHVASFIEEEEYEAVAESSKTGTSLIELFKDFRAWCLQFNYNPYSASYLSAELKQLGFVSYKNSSLYFRMVKKKLENQTGFTVANNGGTKNPFEKKLNK